MKKLLQSISQITLISCTFAGTSHAHIGDLMYVRGDVSWSKFNNISVGDNTATVRQYNDQMNIKGGKYSHKYNFGGVFGFGYLINEKLRAEVVYNKAYADKFKHSDQGTGLSANIKADINAFFGRVSYDVIDLGLTQLFIGGGLGIANVRHKITGKTNVLVTTTPAIPAVVGPPAAPAVDAIQSNQSRQFGFKSKNRNNIAYSLTFGATTKVMDDLRIEASYSFTDYGKTSRVVGMSGGKIILHSHNISLGLRYDLM